MKTTTRLLLTAVVCALSMLSPGCSSTQSTAEVMVIDGCMVSIKGLSTVQAQNIEKNWKFEEGCKVNAEHGYGLEEE